MKRPKKVRIGATRYAIDWTDNLEDGLNGISDQENNKITIRDGYKKEAQTLLHEMIHAGSQALGLEQEEYEIVQIEELVTCIIQDNPGLCYYLVREIRRAMKNGT